MSELANRFIIAATLLVAASSPVWSQKLASAETDPKQLPQLFRTAATRIQPSLVVIETLNGPRELGRWAERESHRFQRATRVAPGINEPVQPAARDSFGSGVIIDKRGYVVTCNHVVAGAEAVFVKMADGRRFEVRDIRTDSYTDLAVLRIEDAGKLTETEFADSDDLQVGDWVVSVGNPYGLANSVSAGIVSALDREIPEVPRTRLIQTDAASNPGNSGGALLDLEGKLIGITEGSYGASEAFQGISFSVPANVASRVVQELIEHGEVKRAYLGCHTENVTLEIAACLGLSEAKGVIITSVTAGSPAADARLVAGDVLVSLDEAAITDSAAMQQLMEAAVPGQRCQLTLIRQRKATTVRVALSRLPGIEKTQLVPDQESEDRVIPEYVDDDFGLHLDNISRDLLRGLGYADDIQGVLVRKVVKHSAAYNQGICAGMLVLSIGDQRTANLLEYKAIRRKAQATTMLILVGAPEGNRHIVFKTHRKARLSPDG